jgi:hypothetical protein
VDDDTIRGWSDTWLPSCSNLQQTPRGARPELCRRANILETVKYILSVYAHPSNIPSVSRQPVLISASLSHAVRPFSLSVNTTAFTDPSDDNPPVMYDLVANFLHSLNFG